MLIIETRFAAKESSPSERSLRARSDGMARQLTAWRAQGSFRNSRPGFRGLARYIGARLVAALDSYGEGALRSLSDRVGRWRDGYVSRGADSNGGLALDRERAGVDRALSGHDADVSRLACAP
jgi:hypothetical protein